MSDIKDQLIDIALEAASGDEFESFAHGVMQDFTGGHYIPTGGRKDGGADGLMLSYVAELEGQPTHFIQCSIEQATESKIKKTVKRLKEVGRDVQALTYVTSVDVAKPDILEQKLERDLGVVIRIRPRSFIRSYINENERMKNHFRAHLGHHLTYLSQIGETRTPQRSAHVKNAAVAVFLRQEIERRGHNQGIIGSAIDALILWALRDTDPDKDLLMNRDEIRSRMREDFPGCDSFVDDASLDRRLQSLSTKRNGTRKVNHHVKEDKYVLPHATRKVLVEEHEQDEALLAHVRDSFARRASKSTSLAPSLVTNTALLTLTLAFENRGLQFASLLSSSANGSTSQEIPDLREPLFAAVGTYASGGNAEALRLATYQLLREAIYSASEDERRYFTNLASTYSIFFLLRQDAALISYFEEMTQTLRLYVGTDIIIQAMSERYLPTENQTATTLLKMAAASGARLLLAESVVEEVLGNLRVNDSEYRNYYETIDRHLDSSLIPEVPKLLVRSYLYNLGKPSGPSSWEEFVGNFVSYSSLRSPTAEVELQRYLTGKFDLTFVSAGELVAASDPRDVSTLTAELLPLKHETYDLAYNDALIVCAVYGDRKSRKELTGENPFGFSTWWLSVESSVLRATGDIVAKNHGTSFLMRPEFLLNYFALAPAADTVRKTYRDVFPAALGITLSRRMDPETVHRLMTQLKEAESQDPARRAALMATAVDAVKADFKRRYSLNLIDGEHDLAEDVAIQ